MKLLLPICLTIGCLAGYKVYKAVNRPPDPVEQMAEMEEIIQKNAELLAQLEQAEAAGDHAEVARILASLTAHYETMVEAFGSDETVNEDIPPAYAALFDAISFGSLDEIRRELRAEPDLNVAVGDFSSTALNTAMMREGRSVEVIRLLLDAGARADFATEEGFGALHFVGDAIFPDESAEELSRIVALLVENGADIEGRTHWGWTPLHVAVMQGDALEMEALLFNGADPNTRFSEDSLPAFSKGMTQLMVAGSEPDKVALLLRYGAEPDGVSSFGQSNVDDFEEALEKARVALSAKTKPDDFDREYVDGFARSYSLLREALIAN